MPQLPLRLKNVIDTTVPEHLRPYMYRMVAKEGASGKDSPTGAQGPLQFTKGTGKRYGLVGPQGDIRKNEAANIQAGVQLTTDNAAILRRHLGREPTFSELALAHQQGADTAGKMLTGTGNAPAKNLAVNNVDPKLPPQAAAEKIMNYYGFNDRMPGLSLSSMPQGFDPTRPGAFAAPGTEAPGAIPSMGAFTPPPGGTTLTSAPADIAAASGAAPTDFRTRLMGANGKGDKGTPYAGIVEGADAVAKGFRQPADPRLNEITPSSVGAGVGQQQAAMAPLAQNMLTQMIQAMHARRGIR